MLVLTSVALSDISPDMGFTIWIVMASRLTSSRSSIQMISLTWLRFKCLVGRFDFLKLSLLMNRLGCD